MVEKKIAVIGHIDHGKTCLAAAVAQVLASQAATPDVQRDVAMFGSKYPREALDFYPTIDPDLTLALLPILQRNFPQWVRVWECAAGDGRMLDILKPAFPYAYGTDVRPLRNDVQPADFLAPLPELYEDAPRIVITNPPYILGDEFVQQAERAAVQWGAHTFLLMRNEFDCANDSPRSPVFVGDFYRGKLILRWRPRWKEGTTGSPRHNYAWFHFGPTGTLHVPPYIRYLDRPKRKGRRRDRDKDQGSSIPAHSE